VWAESKPSRLWSSIDNLEKNMIETEHLRCVWSTDGGLRLSPIFHGVL